MSYLTSKSFWSQTLERATKTAAQVAVTLLVVSTGGLLTVGWAPLLSVVGLAALVSVLTSVGSGAITAGPSGSPSLVDTE